MPLPDRDQLPELAGHGYVYEVDPDALAERLRAVAADAADRRDARRPRGRAGRRAIPGTRFADRAAESLATLEREALPLARHLRHAEIEARARFAVYAPDWCDEPTWGPALDAWVDAFGPDDDVTLALYADGDAEAVGAVVMARLAGRDESHASRPRAGRAEQRDADRARGQRRRGADRRSGRPGRAARAAAPRPPDRHFRARRRALARRGVGVVVLIAASQHQQKAAPFIRALVEHGHRLVRGAADAYLIDLDSPWNRRLYEPHLAGGAKVFLYPHGAPQTAYLYDCDRYPPDPRVTAHFVIGEGQRELLRRVGVDVPVYVVGWPWSDIRPFRPCADPRRVVFGATHAHERDNFLADMHKERNRSIVEQLVAMELDVTVRYLGDLAVNGLEPVDGVTYVEGASDNSTHDIDNADVVIGDGTFACLAVARGRPTIFTDQADFPIVDEPDGSQSWPNNWDDYKDYRRFPYDISDGPLDELIESAAASDEKIAEWRDLFIGQPFNPTAFARLFGELCVDPLVETELREHVVVAFAGEIAERPELLAEYARRVDGDVSTTLVLYAPDTSEDEIVPMLEQAFAATALGDDALPDMLLTALPRHQVYDVALARRASAVLTGADLAGPLAALPNALRPGAPGT